MQNIIERSSECGFIKTFSDNASKIKYSNKVQNIIERSIGADLLKLFFKIIPLENDKIILCASKRLISLEGPKQVVLRVHRFLKKKTFFSYEKMGIEGGCL